ncbi:glycerophosphodiester phosphodiesterase family protein [Rathayibacter soli]|uniref:glycerophosphodiester phosphodiesterase family protein n=1 Tax=Rathayibacter soli TaxID=3144168 RepID=UPI0027E527A0|nr:glycerophosphodiester phosphodiesterase family protein [Glaciibacter superstes]
MRARTSPLIIGHRGACGYRPEHTASAYRLAFALGADAVEPDIVATRDGVLVLRHENEISATTNVARHPEFNDRRTTKSVDGKVVTGWFTEDFTWAELATLRARERLGELRQASRSFDGQYPIMRLRDLFTLVDEVADVSLGPAGIVAEIKHATYFESVGLPLDELFAAELAQAGWAEERQRLVIESFERTVLGKLHQRGVRADRVYLIEASGSPFDEIAAHGSSARGYADEMTEAGLYGLASAPAASRVAGVSVNTSMILSDPVRQDAGADVDVDDDEPIAVSELVDLVHAAGLTAYCWTLRPENRFLVPSLRRGSVAADYGDWQTEYRLLMETGVDGVFTDHPDLALAVRDTL